MDGLQKYAGLVSAIHFIFVYLFLGRTEKDEKLNRFLLEAQNEKKWVFLLFIPVYFKAMGFI